MGEDAQFARAAALRTFLGVRHLAGKLRTLSRPADQDAALDRLITTLDALEYQAQAAVRGHAGCLVAAELAAAHPDLREAAIPLAGAAESWATILDAIAKAAIRVYECAVDLKPGAAAAA